MGNPIRKSSIGLMFASLLLTQPASAQDPSMSELQKEIQALRDSVKAVQKDMQDIKALLAQRGGPPPHAAERCAGSRKPPGQRQRNREADNGGVFRFSVPILRTIRSRD